MRVLWLASVALALLSPTEEASGDPGTDPDTPDTVGNESSTDIGDGLDLPDPEEDAPSVPPVAKVQLEPTLRDRLDALPFEIALRMELRAGTRIKIDPLYRRASLGEARLSLHLEKHIEPAELKFVGDIELLDDHLAATSRPNLMTGDGAVDLRTASFSMQPTSWFRLRMGRQIVTWGVGDLVFVNDVFPKDFRSFVLGRDLTYLKAPTDAGHVELKVGRVDFTALYSPRLNTDRLVTGARVATWNGSQLSIPSEPLPKPLVPDRLFGDDEWALRASMVASRYELALYGYDGFYKSPSAIDEESARPTFSRRRQLGVSARGPFAFGLAWIEAAATQSLGDRSGENPLVPNSEVTGLIGYEFSLGAVATISAQGHALRMSQFGAYERNLPEGDRGVEKLRFRTTARLDLDWSRRELRVSLFSFFNPTEHDGHFRARLEQTLGETVVVVAGANIFYGRMHTPLGQFADASNIYAAIRYAL